MERDSLDRLSRIKQLALVAVVGVAALTGVVSCAWASEPAHNSEPAIASELQARPIDLLTSHDHWQMEGAKYQSGKLVISATNSSIVHQDGSPGIVNPPVNLFGTRLNVKGDFAINTTLTGVNATAEVSLYGKPPLIEDEERAEEGTLDIKLYNNTFTAYVSDQQHGKNAEKLIKTIKPAGTHTIRVADIGGNLNFTIDNKSTGYMSDQGIFKSGNLWFGMDALSSGSKFDVTRLVAKGQGNGQVSVVDTRSLTIPHNSAEGFVALAQKVRPGFIVGAAVAPGPLVSDSTYRKILGENYNGISIENASKFQFIHPLPGNSPSDYNFSDMDGIVAMARKNGLKIHGHAIVFGEALPAWVQDIAKTNPSALKQVLINHITTVASHYKGEVDSWDLNELLADYDAPAGTLGMRENVWYKAMGPQYAVIAAKALRAADPNAKICINDFGMESDDDRFNQMIDLIKYLRDNGAQVDCVGFQAHIDDGDTNAADTHIDVAKLRSRIRTLAALGVKARISELDVSNTPSEYSVFGDVFEACLEEPNCSGVTTWGFTDEFSSAGNTTANGIFEPGTGLPWNVYMQPTPAVADIEKALISH